MKAPRKIASAKRAEPKAESSPDNRKDYVGKWGVYPMSGPLPKGNAPLRGQMEWGQGERGAAGYEDHGSSALTYESGNLLGGFDGNENMDADPARARAIRLGEWPALCEWLANNFRGIGVTFERVDAKGSNRFEARNQPLKAMEARVLESGVSALVIELDTKPNRKRIELDGPRSITLYRNASGYPTRIEIEYARGVGVLHFTTPPQEKESFSGNSWGE